MSSKLIVFTDFGDDPDDSAAAVDYMLEPYDAIDIIITTGDVHTRLKIFYHIFHEWFQNGILYLYSDYFTNEHGTRIHVYIGDTTKREINAPTPDTECYAHNVRSYFNQKRDYSQYDALVLAPLDGLQLPDNFIPRNTVVVGSNPFSLLPRSVNTGSGMQKDSLNVLDANFRQLNKCTNITYLASSHTQKSAPRFNAHTIQKYPLNLQTQCWDIICKFLIGPRPYNLPAGLQKRIGAANAKTLLDICTILGIEVVYSKWHHEQAQKYADKYIGEYTTEKDVEYLRIISTSIQLITGYTLEETLTKPIPQKGVDAFIELMKNNPEIQGTPNYDGYGYWFLKEKAWGWFERNEYNEVK